MSRRGLTACESEWPLACAAHNLRKLHRHRIEGITIRGPIPSDQDLRTPQTATSRPVTAFQDPQHALRAVLCDRLDYACRPTTRMRAHSREQRAVRACHVEGHSSTRET